MTPEFDVIALGETMLSLVATDGPLTSATAFHATHGGAESNTCVGLVRLGHPTAWIGRLGADAIGDRVASALAAEGIDLRWVVRDPAHPTGVMIRDTMGAVTYRRAGSAAAAMMPADLDGIPVDRSRAVVVTGVTALLGEGPQRTALALLETATGLRVVDPNLRPGLWGSDRATELIRPMLERCDLLMGGEIELSSLMGTAEQGEALARRCGELGPREVVIKRGTAGAGVLDEEARWIEHVGERGEDVDPVGAGDAFNAGYIDARLSGRSVAEALTQGAACGAAVASTLGDCDGFPRRVAPAPATHPNSKEGVNDGA